MMRWVFIGLAVLNLALFGWVVTRPPPDDHIPDLPAQVEGMPPLLTLVDRDGPDAVYPDELRCYTLGPFAQSFVASKVQVQLKEAGIDVDRRATKARELAGYWVFIPPAASKEEAVKTTQYLAKEGVEDFFIVLASEKQNAISLGMYKSRAGADERSADVKAKGFEVVTEARYLNISVHWLDFSGGWKEPASEEPWKSILVETPELKITPRPCG